MAPGKGESKKPFSQKGKGGMRRPRVPSTKESTVALQRGQHQKKEFQAYLSQQRGVKKERKDNGALKQQSLPDAWSSQ